MSSTDLTVPETLGAAYATLSFFFITAMVIGSLPSFRAKYWKSADALLSARGTQHGFFVGVSFFAGAMGAWVVYAVPEVGTLLGPFGIIGYSLSMIFPYLTVAWLSPRLLGACPGGYTALDFAKRRYGWVMYYFVLLFSLAYLEIVLIAEYNSAGDIVSAFSGYALESWTVTLGVAIFTCIYTAYGGMGVSIYTDAIQASLVVLLIVLGFSAAFSNTPASVEAIANAAPWTNQGFGAIITLVLAVMGASLFDQTLWQRAYAVKNQKHLWIAVGTAIGLIIPVMLTFGMGGIVGKALYPEDLVGVEYLSFFYLIATLGRGWKGLLVVLTVGLACSTADSVQNAMTTILAVEIARWSPPNASSFVRKNMIWIARAVALVLQAPAIGLALGRLNVLQLFLVADLILLSIAVPLFGGLWQTMTQVGAVCGIVAGIGSVVVQGWVISSDFVTGWANVLIPLGLYNDRSLCSFVLCFVCSAGVSLTVSTVHRVLIHARETRILAGVIAEKNGVDMEWVNSLLNPAPVLSTDPDFAERVAADEERRLRSDSDMMTYGDNNNNDDDDDDDEEKSRKSSKKVAPATISESDDIKGTATTPAEVEEA